MYSCILLQSSILIERFSTFSDWRYHAESGHGSASSILWGCWASLELAYIDGLRGHMRTSPVHDDNAELPWNFGGVVGIFVMSAL